MFQFAPSVRNRGNGNFDKWKKFDGRPRSYANKSRSFASAGADRVCDIFPVVMIRIPNTATLGNVLAFGVSNFHEGRSSKVDTYGSRS